jgi:hypothetical protein
VGQMDRVLDPGGPVSPPQNPVTGEHGRGNVPTNDERQTSVLGLTAGRWPNALYTEVLILLHLRGVGRARW